MKKKEYPGGVKLTATKARAVAMQEFGTTKGLTKEETAMPGYFKMRLGNLFIRIHPDTYDGTGCIVVSAELAFATGQTLKFLNPDTLQDDFDALERHCKRAQRDDLKDWVLSTGSVYAVLLFRAESTGRTTVPGGGVAAARPARRPLCGRLGSEMRHIKIFLLNSA